MGVREMREPACPRRGEPPIFSVPVVDKLRTLTELDPQTAELLTL
jgi:hypothetical protein